MSPSTKRPSRAALDLIDELQARYIAALDNKRFDDWVASFTEAPEASYICTTAENVEHNLPLAWIMDDCHARLEDRVTFITKIWAGTYTDYRTRHFVQRTACRQIDGAGTDGVYEVETNFMILYTPADTGRAEVFADGVYRDRVRISGDDAVFLEKTAITDTPVVQRYVVFPL